MPKKSAKSARGNGENKSAAIRDFITSNPNQGPTAVAEALNTAHGWSITPAYVSTIKNKMKDSKGSSRRGRGAPNIDEKALIQAKELARQTGGIGQAKAALDLLHRLTT